MPLKLSKPDEIPDRGSLCIYGPGGVGKTTLIGSMPGKGLVVEVKATEDGAYVLSDKADRIDVFYLESFNDLDDVYKEVKAHIKMWNWIAFDTVTGIQELAQRKVVRERDLKADPHKMTQPEFGHMANLVGEAVFKFKALNIWTIWAAQERRHGGGEDDPGPVMYGPDILPSALRKLWPPMMLGGRLFVQTAMDGSGGLERGLRIGTNELYWAKCRALPGKRPPPVIKDPKLDQILAYLLSDGPKLKRLKTELEF